MDPSIVENLRFDQHDLAGLCREREPGTGELTIMNECYGIGRILRQYARVPHHEPLAFSYEHVIPFAPGVVPGCDLNDGLPAFLTSIPEQVEPLREAGFVRPVAGGFGLHYARRVLADQHRWEPPATRAGTLAFPAKSTIEVDRSFDFREYARHLHDLPALFQPVAVCIYWKDYLRGSHQCYLDLGIPVFTCGHMFDPHFLLRFIDLCSRFRFSCGNGIASSYPLSVVCGCHFFENRTGPVMEFHPTAGKEAFPAPLAAHSTYGSKLAALAPFPPQDAHLAGQARLAAELTGRDRVLEPRAILELHQWSRDYLLARQEPGLGFVSRVEHATLNRWLRRHVQNNGWAASGASITPASHPGYSTFEIYLKVSPKISPEGQDIAVRIGGKPALSFHGPPGFHRVRLPLAACREQPVTLTLSQDTEGPEGRENRIAFRFLGFRVIGGEAAGPDFNRLQRSRLPAEFTVPDGW